MSSDKPPQWLSVAVRQGLVLREGSPNTDFRCTEVTDHVWKAILAERKRVMDEGYAEYQRSYEERRQGVVR